MTYPHTSHDAIDVSDVSPTADLVCRNCLLSDEELSAHCNAPFSPEEWNRELVAIEGRLVRMDKIASLAEGRQRGDLLTDVARLRDILAESRIT